MASFSKQSLNSLATCDVRLQNLFREVVKHFDCTVLQGHRTKEEQDKFFNEGKSKVRFPNSKHNVFPSKAVDVAPYPIDWNDRERFYLFVGFVLGVASQMGIDVRSGGDWDRDTELKDNSFDDLPHFEIVE